MVKVTPTQDGNRRNVYNGNVLIGYVENDTLYGIDADGYALPICTIEHENEIAGRLAEWQAQQ